MPATPRREPLITPGGSFGTNASQPANPCSGRRRRRLRPGRGTERQGPGGRSVPSPDFRAATALKYAPFSASLVPVFAPTQSRRCRYCTAVNRCVPDLTITKTVPVLRDRGSSVCNVCRGGPAKMHDHSPESSVSAGEVSAVNDTSPADCRNRTPHRRIALESDVCENMT